LGEIKSNKVEIFSLTNNTKKNIVALLTTTNSKILSEFKTVYIDGIFKSFPKLFYQLFIIHGFKNTTYNPLVFFY